MTVPDYVAAFISEEDYLPEVGLAAIEGVCSKIPTDFELGSTQVHPKTVQITLHFDVAEDVLTRARQGAEPVSGGDVRRHVDQEPPGRAPTPTPPRQMA